MAARKTCRAHRDEVRHDIGTGPGKNKFQDHAQQRAAGDRREDEQSRSTFLVDDQKTDDDSRHQRQYRRAAKARNIAVYEFEPGSTNRIRKIAGISQRQEHPPIKSLRLALNHLDEFGEKQHSSRNDDDRDESAYLDGRQETNTTNIRPASNHMTVEPITCGQL